MHVNDCDFKQSVAWLNDRFGEGATIEAVTYKTREIIHSSPVLEFTPPVPEESKWQEVRKYLTRSRKLPSGLVDSLHQQGLIYKDVVVAYDNDQAGNLMAQRTLSQLPNAVVKTQKANDWNEDLVNRFNWSNTNEKGDSSVRKVAQRFGVSKNFVQKLVTSKANKRTYSSRQARWLYDKSCHEI